MARRNKNIGATLSLNQGNFFTNSRSAVTSTNQLKNATTDATGSLRKMGKEGDNTGGILSRAGGKIGSAFKVASAAIVAGTAAAVTGLGAMIVKTSQAADEIDKMSIRTGISRTALQELKYAAEQTDVAFDKIQTGANYLSRNMVSAANGSRSQADAFRKLGVAVTDASGNIRSAEEVLYDTMDALSQIPNEAERVALGSKVMGRGFIYLAPLVAEGTDGIREYAQRAHDLGLVMSDEAIAANVQFGNSMTTIRASLRGVTSQIATQALPIVNGFLDKIITNLPRLQNGLRSALGFLQRPLNWLINTAFPALARVLVTVKDFGVSAFNNIRAALERNQPTFDAVKRVAIDIGERLWGAFEFCRPALDWLKDTALPLLVDGLAGVLSIATGVYDFFVNNWSWIAPIIAGITGAVLAYKAAVIGVNVVEKIRAGIKGIVAVKTVILTAKQWLLNIAMSANPIGIIILAIGALIAIGVALWMNWDKICEWCKAAFAAVKDWFVSIGTAIADFFTGLWDGIKGVVISVWDGITGFLSGVWNAISGTAIAVFEGIKNAILNVWNGIWNGIKGIINLILGGINGLIRGVVNGVNGIINGINRVTGFVGIPAIPTLTAPQIPMLAKGGVIQQAGRVIVGERGAEYLDLPKGAKVSPLDRVKNEDGRAFDMFAGVKNAVIGACENMASAVSSFMSGIAGNFGTFNIEIAPVVADYRRTEPPPVPRKEPKPPKDKEKTEHKITINIYADGKSCDEIVNDLMPKLKLALANL